MPNVTPAAATTAIATSGGSPSLTALPRPANRTAKPAASSASPASDSRSRRGRVEGRRFRASAPMTSTVWYVCDMMNCWPISRA